MPILGEGDDLSKGKVTTRRLSEIRKGVSGSRGKRGPTAGRILISGGEVVERNGTSRRADVLIEDGRISLVGVGISVDESTPRIDAKDRYVLPGLVNAHTHAHNNLSRSIGDNWTLEQLRSRGPALYGDRTPEEQYLSAALGAVEMLKSGCTAAYDQFAALPALTGEGIEAVVKAYADVGLRAVLAPAISDQPFYEVIPGLLDVLPLDLRRIVERVRQKPARALLDLTEHAIRRWNGMAGGRIRMAIAPVIPQLCSDELIAGCSRLALEYGVSVQTHLAESKVQAVSAYKRWGKSIVMHLDDLGLVGPQLVAGHAVWVTDLDIARLADAGCVVAHNPASNLRLGNGIAPVAEMLRRGITVGLGSDGSHSSDNQNMFEAMRFAALVGNNRFPYHPESWIGAKEAWNMATVGGARVIGMGGELGEIRAGARADLVLLRRSSVFLTPANDLLNQFVYSETGANVTDVLVDGRHVLKEGRVLTLDEDRLFAEVEKAMERVSRRNASKWVLAERLDPFLNATCGRIAAQPFEVNRYSVESEP